MTSLLIQWNGYNLPALWCLACKTEASKWLWSWHLCVLWLNHLESSSIGTHNHVLQCKQEQWQYSVTVWIYESWQVSSPVKAVHSWPWHWSLYLLSCSISRLLSSRDSNLCPTSGTTAQCLWLYGSLGLSVALSSLGVGGVLGLETQTEVRYRRLRPELKTTHCH